MNPAEDFVALEVAIRHFSMAKADMVDMVDMVESIDMNMVDNIGMVNVQTNFGYLKLLVETVGWTRRTW